MMVVPGPHSVMRDIDARTSARAVEFVVVASLLGCATRPLWSTLEGRAPEPIDVWVAVGPSDVDRNVHNDRRETIGKDAQRSGKVKDLGPK